MLGDKFLLEKFIVTFIILGFLVELIVIDPGLGSTTAKDDQFSEIPNKKLLPVDANELLANTPRAFTANRGQLENDAVRFYDQGGGLWFTDDGVWFELREYIDEENDRELNDPFNPMARFELKEPPKYRRIVFKQEFVGANLVIPIGRDRLSWNSNFFYGNDSSKWRTEVPNYREIYYENLYDDIDLVYKIVPDGIKYDFIIHPGGIAQDIQLEYESVEVKTDGINLFIETSVGTVIDGGLYVYQIEGDEHIPVEEKLVVKDRVVNYNNYDSTLPLIIDPLIYSTFIGGNSEDGCYAMEIDIIGNAYVTGRTRSINFPTTPGAYDRMYNSSSDVFIFKLNKNGSALYYSTYIGGMGHESGWEIAIDSKGNAFVTGYTTSSDFPVTASAYDTFHSIAHGINYDAFVLKLNQTGSSIIYSTFIGGERQEWGESIAIDSNNNAYVTGVTELADLLIPPGAYNTTFGFTGSKGSIYVIKLNSNGSKLIYCTYIVGNGWDIGMDIAVDSVGNTYVIGMVKSSNFPTTMGSYDTTFNGGGTDACLFKLNTTGSKLINSTYIGGNDYEAIYELDMDSNSNLFLAGQTNSSNFPITPGAYDTTLNGEIDIFLLKMNSNCSSLLYSTYFGGNNRDIGNIELDNEGNILLTGNTNSTDFPLTLDAIYNTLNKGNSTLVRDAFITKINIENSTLLYSTYLSGLSDDGCSDIAIDNYGDIYLAGGTSSSDFPTTPGAYDTSHNGGWDVLVIKLSIGPIINITSLSLLMNTTSTNLVYSRLCQYTFRVNITDTASLTDLGFVRLTFDPLGTNIKLFWDRSTRKFSKLSDPNNYVSIDSSSKVYNYFDFWAIDFNVTFNWNYPDENLHNVQAYATSAILSPAWFNATEFYRVENDLVFNGKLKVKGEDNRTIADGELVCGGEKINWTGLTVVYEDTTDVYPPVDEFNVSIWDEIGNSWLDSPAAGGNFTIQTVAASATDLDGDIHTINITGIPPECDATNETFTIRIDGDNVTFSNPTPDNTTWETTSTFVLVGVTITDIGGGEVKGSSVKRCFSTDNGKTWSDWNGISKLKSGKSIKPQDLIFLEEGKNNLIKWQAEDSVGNGPVESDEYRILIDLESVIFSNALPSADYESPSEEVEIGITISDVISGVDAATVEYAISKDDGVSWSSWMSVPGLEAGSKINIALNLTFPDGTRNRIKWRASDLAGNGPTESEIYQIKVNTWLQQFIPKVKLWSPPNGSIITTTSAELFWMLENTTLWNVNYDVYIDTVNPPEIINQSIIINTSLIVNDLIDGETYYWTVIPRIGIYKGMCGSGIWSFIVDIPLPQVKLTSPENGSIVPSIKPTLSWSVEYEGSEILSYDVYLDTNIAPIEYEKCPDIYFLPQGTLEDNKTYYWKVVPWAGNVKGPESETWSFTVNRDYRPRFELRLTVNPPYLEQVPGDVVSVQATVFNLGELTDTISLSVDVPADADIIAVVNDPGTLGAGPDGNAEFNITVTIAESAKKGEVVLTVTAVSGKAAEYDLIVEENAELTVKIFGIDKPEDHSSSFLFTFLNILLIIIIIIIILVLVIVVNNRRKLDKKKKSTKETVTVKPGEVPTAVIAVDQAPMVAQLHDSSAANVAQELPTTTSTTPALSSSPSAAQAPASQQIPQSPQLPQLPPAPSKLEESEKGEVTVPEPTVVTPSPTLQRTPNESQNKNSERQ